MAINQLVGDKSIFAIEFKLEQLKPRLLGNVCLWLNEKYIGAFDDTHLIKSSLFQLKSLLNRNLASDQFAKLNAENAFQKIKTGSYGEHFLSLGESFDDFSVVVFEFNSEYRFLWKLHDAPFFNYPNYPAGIQEASVDREYFSAILTEVEELLESNTLH